MSFYGTPRLAIARNAGSINEESGAPGQRGLRRRSPFRSTHAQDRHRLGVCGQGLQIAGIGRQDRSSWFACATTSASTAEPLRARVLSSAARRASVSGRAAVTSQALRNRFCGASRPAWPSKHSTKTTDGTRGGQSPSSRSARMSANALGERSARWLTPPESRISNGATRPCAAAVHRASSRRRLRQRVAERLVFRPPQSTPQHTCRPRLEVVVGAPRRGPRPAVTPKRGVNIHPRQRCTSARNCAKRTQTPFVQGQKEHGRECSKTEDGRDTGDELALAQ